MKLRKFRIVKEEIGYHIETKGLGSIWTNINYNEEEFGLNAFWFETLEKAKNIVDSLSKGFYRPNTVLRNLKDSKKEVVYEK